MQKWNIEEVPYNGMTVTFYHLDYKGRKYSVIFTKIEDTKTPESIAQKSDELGLIYQPYSYDIKYDLTQNIDSGDFYASPDDNKHFDYIQMIGLGRLLCDVLIDHSERYHASAYYALALDDRLKKFYDVMVKKCSDKQFSITMGIGEEGLGYEIKKNS